MTCPSSASKPTPITLKSATPIIKHSEDMTERRHDETADNDDEMSDSNKGEGKYARTCCSLRTSTIATTGVMTMMVEATVAAVVGMAISQQGTDERGRRATHDNQRRT